MSESKGELETLADLFKREIIRFDLPYRPKFEISGPCKLTVKQNGTYSKVPFIGEESLVLFNVYAGKKDVIFVFLNSNLAPVSTLMVREHIQHIEIPLNQAESFLAGFKFKKWVDEVLEKYDEQTIVETKLRVAVMEEVAHEEAKRDPFKENPLWGSW